MRTALLVGTICLLVACGCGRPRRSDNDSNDKIDLTQNVTAERKPQDKSFVGFERNWRQFISVSPELARPVLEADSQSPEHRWEPRVTSECVVSADAGGLVPQVTLSWNEEQQKEPPALRFDLAILHDGFARNYYSAALATDKLQRFKLPPGSALIKDEEAVLLTGPGLFPKIVDFTVQAIQDRDSGRPLARRTLVLRDLSHGWSYTIRIDCASANAWKEYGRYVFLTAVCPRGL